MTPKLVIIDADLFIFLAGWEYRDKLNMLGGMAFTKKLDLLLEAVLVKTQPDFFLGFFGQDGSKNFRHDFATLKPYKGTRKNTDWADYFKPIAKKHFAEKWKFYGVSHIEADDACSIAHHTYKDTYDIIHVSEDKDAKQMAPFVRYNPNPSKKCFEEISAFEGRAFLYYQGLVGDSSDSIPGIPGVGEKSKLIPELYACNTEEELFSFVQEAYIEKYKEDYLPFMTENFILLQMLKKPMYDYPNEIVLQPYKQAKPAIKLIDI
jgi:5'-3' exonuclease